MKLGLGLGVSGRNINPQVSGGVPGPPGEPPTIPPGDIIDDGSFQEPPIVITAEETIQFKGKKASGASGKFIYNIGVAEAGITYTMRYDPDWSGLANQGLTALVGFGLKQGNDFHLGGLKGDGAGDLLAYEIYGTNKWNHTSGFTTVNGGATANGTKDGPNWVRFAVSADGATYTVSTSADGETWSEELTDVTPSPFGATTSPPVFGIAVFLEAADAGHFTVEIELWQESATEEGAEGPGDHRYWRVFVETNAGDGNFISIGETEWYDSPYNGVNLLTGGTITASSEFNGSFIPTRAISGDYFVHSQNDRWASSSTGGTDEWLKYDFGAGNEVQVLSVGIFAPMDGEFDQCPAGIRVEYSDDNSSWTTAWSDTLASATDDLEFLRSSHPDFIPDTPSYGTHTYWRIYVQTSQGGSAFSPVSAAEIEMRATSGGADQCTGGTPSASEILVGTAADIFDNNNSTFWAINGPGWVKYQFASPVTVAEIAYRIRNDGNPGHAPKDFIVQFSDDNSQWSTAWQVLSEPSWSDGEQRIFTSPDIP